MDAAVLIQGSRSQKTVCGVSRDKHFIHTQYLKQNAIKTDTNPSVNAKRDRQLQAAKTGGATEDGNSPRPRPPSRGSQITSNEFNAPQ